MDIQKYFFSFMLSVGLTSNIYTSDEEILDLPLTVATNYVGGGVDDAQGLNEFLDKYLKGRNLNTFIVARGFTLPEYAEHYHADQKILDVLEKHGARIKKKIHAPKKLPNLAPVPKKIPNITPAARKIPNSAEIMEKQRRAAMKKAYEEEQQRYETEMQQKINNEDIELRHAFKQPTPAAHLQELGIIIPDLKNATNIRNTVAKAYKKRALQLHPDTGGKESDFNYFQKEWKNLKTWMRERFDIDFDESH